MSHTRHFLTPMFLLLVTGCSTVPTTDYGKLGLVEVSGTITLDDEALANAVVTFEDSTTGQFSYGLTDFTGRYTLQLDSVQQGVVPGEKIVRISTKRKILGLNASEEGGDEEGEESSEESGSSSDEERVPAKYNSESELKVTVSDSQTTFDFEL